MSFAFFVEMAWKSAAIAGAALLIAMLMRSRSAADRTALLRTAVALLLALPAVSLFLPGIAVEMAVPVAPQTKPILLNALAPVQAAPAELAPAAAQLAATSWDNPGLVVGLLYLGGLIMIGLRLLAGLWTLRRWTRGAAEVSCPEWRDALARARADGAPPLRLLVSYEASSPLSWGWRRPVVLLDPDSLRRSDDADAILAHEIAHIVRRDWVTLMLSRLSVALFWFNPLVWLLERKVVEEAEEAADSEAVARVEPSRYAQTLLNCARHAGRLLPANSIASAALGRRVHTVLDGGLGRSRSRWTFAAMGACVALAGPVAATKLVPALPAATAELPKPVAKVGPLVVSMSEAPIFRAVAAVSPEPAAPLAATAEAPPVPPAALALVQPVAAPPMPQTALPPEAPARPAAPARPEAPEPAIDVDTLVQFGIHGVSGAYVEELTTAVPNRFTPDQMVKMRIHGVSGAYIREMAKAGYNRLTADQLITMRIHGVSASMARKAASKAGDRPSVEQLVSYAIHGKL